MTDQDNNNPPKGEPIQPIWLEGQTPAEQQDAAGPGLPLNYRPLGSIEPATESKHGRAIGFGMLGIFSAIGLGIFIVVLLANNVAMGWEVPFIVVVSLSGLVGASLLNWRANWRGYFPGFLIGVGLFFLCPIVTFAIICGGLGKGSGL